MRDKPNPTTALLTSAGVVPQQTAQRRAIVSNRGEHLRTFKRKYLLPYLMTSDCTVVCIDMYVPYGVYSNRAHSIHCSIEPGTLLSLRHTSPVCAYNNFHRAYYGPSRDDTSTACRPLKSEALVVHQTDDPRRSHTVRISLFIF